MGVCEFLLATSPIAWPSSVVGHGDDAQLLCRDLVNDAVGESSQDIAPPGTSKYSPDSWVDHNESNHALELRDEGEPEFNGGTSGVAGGGFI